MRVLQVHVWARDVHDINPVRNSPLRNKDPPASPQLVIAGRLN